MRSKRERKKVSFLYKKNKQSDKAGKIREISILSRANYMQRMCEQNEKRKKEY